MIFSLPATTRNVGAQLSRQYSLDMARNRRVLLKITSTIRFLAQQALAFRGHNNDEDGNLLQLLKHHGETDSEVLQWLDRKSGKYLFPECQNELIKMMSLRVLRELMTKFKESPFVIIMIDETTDITNKEQVTFVLRTVDENFQVDEDFLGLYTVSCIDASTLFSTIKDVLLRFNISFRKLRGQCYDGCSTMSGSRSGVAKRVQDEEARAVFTHCYSHSLNLAAGDSIKKSKIMKSTLETTHEITKLIKLSPRRQGVFMEVQQESEMSSESDVKSTVKLLCPTRWTVRADSLHSIIDNYSELLETWDRANDIARDTETKARIQGVASQMETFDFMFGTYLGELILKHTDNLSKTLQHKTCSAAEGQKIAGLVVKTLEAIRSEDSFNLFWS